MLEQNLPLFSNSHILISKEVMFGVKFLSTSYGFLFIALLEKVLHKFYLTVVLLLFGLFLVVSTLIFIWKKTPEFCNYFKFSQFLFPFSMLGRFPETIFVHLLPVLLLKCFTCMFFLIWVSPPDLDLLFHTELYDFLSAKIYFVPMGLWLV